MLNIHYLYYGHVILQNFSHLLATSTLFPSFYLKASSFMPFHVSLIQQLEIWRIYQFSKYIKARMNCSFFAHYSSRLSFPTTCSRFLNEMQMAQNPKGLTMFSSPEAASMSMWIWTLNSAVHVGMLSFFMFVFDTPFIVSEINFTMVKWLKLRKTWKTMGGWVGCWLQINPRNPTNKFVPHTSFVSCLCGLEVVVLQQLGTRIISFLY